MTEKLDNFINVSRQFLRSINLEADLGREDALQGYVCQETASELLDVMSQHITQSSQRAFTWTGPYGGGKSSLALMLCSLVYPSSKLRKKAWDQLSMKQMPAAKEAWKSSDEGWLILPIVGKRDSVITAISNCLDEKQNKKTSKSTASEVIDRLVKESASRKNDGVLLVIDELGKFLESAASQGDDIYFYQQLAEAASRAKGKLIIVGILHQAFEQYALKLGRDARDEWAKIQGRYVDIPLVVKTDEVIELVGRAIEKRNITTPAAIEGFAETVACVIAKRRLNVPSNLKTSLVNCWPLHPVTASLLGPVSRKRFSQNERSIFGFLASAEPISFTQFLKSTEVTENLMYGPEIYWDYLKVNLEQSISASSEAHIWALANDCIERVEAKSDCTALHVKLAKTVALIDMFRSTSGLAAETQLLSKCFNDYTSGQIEKALNDLSKWSILVYRKHLEAWTIYSGSDFDIDLSVNQARSEIGNVDVKQLVELAELNPVVAKRHFHETGTLRWLSKTLIHQDVLEDYLDSFVPKIGAAGEFILVIPSDELSYEQNQKNIAELSKVSLAIPIVLGLASNANKIYDLGLELSALQRLQKTKRELEGDSVARKEVNSRIATIKLDLSEELKNSFDTAIWYQRGAEIRSTNFDSLTTIASDLVDKSFSHTPVIFNELINRENISSNVVKARRDLMYRMLNYEGKARLGYEGFPADAGLFYTVIEANDLYSRNENDFSFTTNNNTALSALWKAADELFKFNKDKVTLTNLFEVWQSPPIGARKGVLPLFALIYFLSNKHNLTLYIENTFIPELTEAYLDEWMQDTNRVAFKYVEIGKDKTEILRLLSDSLTKKLGRSVAATPLDSARGLVSLVAQLPNWSKRTSSISSESQEFRRLILRANDPFKVLFTDLPEILKVTNETELIKKITVLTDELEQAYPVMLKKFREVLFSALDHKGSLEELNARAKIILSKSGDFGIDAFILGVSTLSKDKASLEVLLSTTINKHPREWVDRDQEKAFNSIAELCTIFRKTEAFIGLRGETSQRNAFAFVYSDPKKSTISDSFDVAESKLPELIKISSEMLSNLTDKGLSKDEILATLAQCCSEILDKR